jgi:hypothetical protein
MTTPKSLSPAAQKLKEAVILAFWDQTSLPSSPEVVAAAVIRALVESHGTPTRGGAVVLSEDDVLAIATELEKSDA